MDVSKLKGMKRDISKSIQYDKTEWVDEQTVIDAAKLNKIEDALDKVITANNGVDDLITNKTVEAIKIESINGLSTQEKTVKGAINELKGKCDDLLQNVSNGKSSIAQAITSKGVQASANDTFEGLSTKIKSIKSGKYDSGDTLKEGVHFKFSNEPFEKDDFFEKYNITIEQGYVGNVFLSSDNYIIVEISKSGAVKEYIMYRYNSDSDTVSKERTISSTDGTLRQEGIKLIDKYIESNGILIDFGGPDGPSPNYDKDGLMQSKVYYSEYESKVYSLVAKNKVEENFLKMYFSLYELKGNSFELLEDDIPSNNKTGNASNLIFTVGENYFCIASSNQGNAFIETIKKDSFDIKTISPKQSLMVQDLKEIDVLFSLNDFIFYSIMGKNPTDVEGICIQNIEDQSIELKLKQNNEDRYFFLGSSRKNILYNKEKQTAYIPLVTDTKGKIELMKQINIKDKNNVQIETENISTKNIKNSSEIIFGKRYKDFDINDDDDNSTIVLL